jgi:uncharacterized protein
MDQTDAPIVPETTPLSPQPAVAPSELNVASDEGLFDGPRGVGWGFLAYIMLAVVIYTALTLITRFLLPHKLGFLWGFVLSEFTLLVSGFTPAFILAKLETRPFDAYGLPRRGAFGKLFWVGMLWGIVSISALILALYAFGGFHFSGLAIHGAQIVKFAVFWMVMFVVVGLFEEFLLRGYTQFTLSRGLGFWPTAVMLSCAFGALHLNNPGEDIFGALGAALIGLFFCLTLRRTGNLWFAVGMHASWDWGETFLYGVPNSGLAAPGHLVNSTIEGPRWLSGGAVGPEASTFAFLLVALMFVLFHFMYRETKYV